MIIENTESYTLITSEEKIFENFFSTFKEKYSDLQKNHLIIQLSDNLNVVEENILLFLSYAELHQQNKMTFVIVYKNVDVDTFPETFNIVPTLHEAEDVLEMENIQRDLGF